MISSSCTWDKQHQRKHGILRLCWCPSWHCHQQSLTLDNPRDPDSKVCCVYGTNMTHAGEINRKASSYIGTTKYTQRNDSFQYKNYLPRYIDSHFYLYNGNTYTGNKTLSSYWNRKCWEIMSISKVNTVNKVPDHTSYFNCMCLTAIQMYWLKVNSDTNKQMHWNFVKRLQILHHQWTFRDGLFCKSQWNRSNFPSFKSNINIRSVSSD